jgi:hypothetical protein
LCRAELRRGGEVAPAAGMGSGIRHSQFLTGWRCDSRIFTEAAESI